MLTKPEAKQLLEALFVIPRSAAAHGPMVPLASVLGLLEGVCAGGYTTTLAAGNLSVNLPTPDPVPLAQPRAVADPRPTPPRPPPLPKRRPLSEPPAHDDRGAW